MILGNFHFLIALITYSALVKEELLFFSRSYLIGLVYFADMLSSYSLPTSPATGSSSPSLYEINLAKIATTLVNADTEQADYVRAFADFNSAPIVRLPFDMTKTGSQGLVYEHQSTCAIIFETQSS